MASSYEVTCVSRSKSLNNSMEITHLGGQNPFGRTWRVSLNEAIHGIIEGRWTFFVNVGGVRRNLLVAVNLQGSKYLKTELDGKSPEGLLSLPDCPGDGDLK